MQIIPTQFQLSTASNRGVLCAQCAEIHAPAGLVSEVVYMLRKNWFSGLGSEFKLAECPSVPRVFGQLSEGWIRG